MIDIRKLKELVRLMVTNDLSELDLRDEQQQVTVKRGGNQAQPVIQQVAPAVAAPAAAPAAVAPPAAAAPEPAADDGLVPIESPMVGTFYAKPNPEKPNFVSVGDSIGPDSVVCLIEAMKIFNEIKAERSGTVAKVLVENGDAVEFGQPMLLIKPE
ncbi:MAG: acetyl-CoA carboxylase biotin carboxyl carrier protein [Phycisphaerales bacterium]|nr:acetyl-CoA carboxylase biotin carboxyl carrier protein [Phycisphaerales bacterium]